MAASKHTTSITTGLAYSYWSVQTLDAQKTGRDWPVMSSTQQFQPAHSRLKLLRTRHNRPISARFLGVQRLHAPITICQSCGDARRVLACGHQEKRRAADCADSADFNPFNPRNPWLIHRR